MSSNRIFEVVLTRTHESQLAIGAANVGTPLGEVFRAFNSTGVDAGLYPSVIFDPEKGWMTSFDAGVEENLPTQIVSIYAERRNGGAQRLMHVNGQMEIYASFANKTAHGTWAVTYLRHRHPDHPGEFHLGGLMDVDSIACLAYPGPLVLHQIFSATDGKKDWEVVEHGAVPDFTRYMLAAIRTDVEQQFGQGKHYFRARMKRHSAGMAWGGNKLK